MPVQFLYLADPSPFPQDSHSQIRPHFPETATPKAGLFSPRRPLSRMVRSPRGGHSLKAALLQVSYFPRTIFTSQMATAKLTATLKAGPLSQNGYSQGQSHFPKMAILKAGSIYPNSNSQSWSHFPETVTLKTGPISPRRPLSRPVAFLVQLPFLAGSNSRRSLFLLVRVSPSQMEFPT